MPCPETWKDGKARPGEFRFVCCCESRMIGRDVYIRLPELIRTNKSGPQFGNTHSSCISRGRVNPDFVDAGVLGKEEPSAFTAEAAQSTKVVSCFFKTYLVMLVWMFFAHKTLTCQSQVRALLERSRTIFRFATS